MKIAIDITPIKDVNSGHKVRGVGMYIKTLEENLPLYDKKNSYVFFDKHEILKKEIDIIHYPYFDPFFITLPLKKNKKTVVTVHDLTPIKFPLHFPAGIRGTLKWTLQKKLLKQVDAIITDSDSSMKDVMQLTGIEPSKVHTVYLSASNTFRKLKKKNRIEEIKKKFSLPKTFALYVGDATWNKNLPRLIQAIKKSNVPFVMVGKTLAQKDFDHTNKWNKDLVIVEKETTDKRLFIKLGFVAEEDLVALYNAALFLIMPSLYEGFGLPVLEAMQSGCPVITTKEGSLPEVGGDSVLYVDYHSIESIVSGIKELQQNNKRRIELSQKGLKQAEKFSIKHFVENNVKVYSSVYER